MSFLSGVFLQWWELHFHVFYAATGIVGVTEAQLLVRKKSTPLRASVSFLSVLSFVCGVMRVLAVFYPFLSLEVMEVFLSWRAMSVFLLPWTGIMQADLDTYLLLRCIIEEGNGKALDVDRPR